MTTLPFGEECTTGPCAANPGVASGQPRKFTGKERDAETGLDYFGARYYGSKIGRFTTVDPVYNWRENLLDPQRWNRYAYGRNNPLRYVDPDGREVVPYETLEQARADYEAGAQVLTGVGKWLANVLLALNSPGHMTPEAESRYYYQADGPIERIAMEATDLGLLATAVGGAYGRAVRGPYASLEDSAGVGAGKPYTQAQKQAIYDANRARNEGVLRSDQTGTVLAPSEKSRKGVSTPANAAQVDHRKARSKGGSNSYGNAQVLSAKENREKGAN